MTELERILDQLTRAFEGNAWCGQSVTEALSGVTPEQAFAHPIKGAHSIAELTLHIGTWESVIRRGILGEEVLTVTEDENFPPVTEKSADAWAAIVNSVVKGHLALREAVANFDMRRIDEVPPGARSSIYVLLHGVIQHDLYHAAQIALLKK